MSNATTSAPARKPSSKKPATFSITFRIGEDRYGVAPVPAHPEVALKAYRFTKLTGDHAVYCVSLTPDLHPSCECKGWLRWQTPCKHIRSLVAAGMLPRSCVEPVRPS